MSKAYPVSNYQDYRKYQDKARPSRNPYWQKIRDFRGDKKFCTVLADEFTEEQRGKWREYFGMAQDAFLNVELGSYHGETSIHLAKTNPKNAHIGVEWKYKQCFMGGKKAQDQKLQNLTFLRANNARLPWMFAPGEIDRVWVLFPDPWSKLAQNKWRLLQPGFFRLLGNMLAEGKELMIKTDHEEYSQFIAASILEAGCFDPMDAEKAKANWSLIPPTPFERIFLRQGLPTFPFALVRNSKQVIAPAEVQEILARH